MEKELFDVSERFSESMDRIYGTERFQNLGVRFRAWLAQSPGRKVLVGTVAVTGMGFVVGLLSRQVLKRKGPQIKERSARFRTRLRGRFGQARKRLSEVRERVSEKIAS